MLMPMFSSEIVTYWCYVLLGEQIVSQLPSFLEIPKNVSLPKTDGVLGDSSKWQRV